MMLKANSAQIIEMDNAAIDEGMRESDVVHIEIDAPRLGKYTYISTEYFENDQLNSALGCARKHTKYLGFYKFKLITRVHNIVGENTQAGEFTHSLYVHYRTRSERLWAKGVSGEILSNFNFVSQGGVGKFVEDMSRTPFSTMKYFNTVLCFDFPAGLIDDLAEDLSIAIKDPIGEVFYLNIPISAASALRSVLGRYLRRHFSAFVEKVQVGNVASDGVRSIVPEIHHAIRATRSYTDRHRGKIKFS